MWFGGHPNLPYNDWEYQQIARRNNPLKINTVFLDTDTDIN